MAMGVQILEEIENRNQTSYKIDMTMKKIHEVLTHLNLLSCCQI